MNDKIASLLEAVRKNAREAGDAASNAAYLAGKKGEAVFSNVKLNMQILGLQNDIRNALAEIGQMVYDTHTGGTDNQEALLEKLREIDQMHAQIADIEVRIGRAEVIRTCPVCGAEARDGDAYCGQCGEKL